MIKKEFGKNLIPGPRDPSDSSEREFSSPNIANPFHADTYQAPSLEAF